MDTKVFYYTYVTRVRMSFSMYGSLQVLRTLVKYVTIHKYKIYELIIVLADDVEYKLKITFLIKPSTCLKTP